MAQEQDVPHGVRRIPCPENKRQEKQGAFEFFMRRESARGRLQRFLRYLSRQSEGDRMTGGEAGNTKML